MTINTTPQTALPIHSADQYQQAYLDLGFKLFKLKVHDKRPATKNGFHDAVANKINLGRGKDAKGNALPKFNLGVTPPVDCVVIDVDSTDALDWLRTLSWWSENTLAFTTPKGYHFVWKCAGVSQWGKNGNSHFGKNVDIRVSGSGYVVGAGSIVPNSKTSVLSTYAPIPGSPTTITDMPAQMSTHTRDRAAQQGATAAIPAAISPNFGVAPTGGNNSTVVPAHLKNRVGQLAGTVTMGVTKTPTTKPTLSAYIIPESTRNNTLHSLASELFFEGYVATQVVEFVHEINLKHCIPPCDTKSLQASILSAYKYWAKMGREPGYKIMIEPTDYPKGNIELCLAAIKYEVRRSVYSHKPDMKGRDTNKYKQLQPGGWASIGDVEYNEIYSDFQKICRTKPYFTKEGERKGGNPLKIARVDYDKNIYSIAEDNIQNPFLDVIESYPAWDGVPRLATMLTDIYTVKTNHGVAAWIPYSIMVGAITRAYNPGYPHDETVVTIGKQGVGKSMLWKYMLPDTEFFSDSLNITGSDKERIESIGGKVIIEWAEMTGLKKAELERTKSFLTRQIDKVRLAFRRNDDEFPRASIIVATTNDKQALPNDPTGNRRFVTIEVDTHSDFTGQGDEYKSFMRDRIFAYRDANREQVWAEVLHCYNEGTKGIHRGHMADGLENIIAAENEEHRSRDTILEDAIDRLLGEGWLGPKGWPDGTGGFDGGNIGMTMQELDHRIRWFMGTTDKAPADAYIQNQIGKILRKHNVDKRKGTRIDKATKTISRPRVWFKS